MLLVVIGILVLFFFLSGIRIVRPTHRGLVERLGKYNRFAQPGFHWVFPVIERMIRVNITEQMVDAQPQEIITNDNLNARVDAQVYFKVKADEESVKSSQYNVNNYQYQIVNLARTTLRNIIGTLTLKSANSERDKINGELLTTLANETRNWGMEIVRTELKEIAWECPEHSGYHMNSDWLLVEFVSDGERFEKAGEKIIVSSLYNYAMPLLRYEIGDRGRALDGMCPCGRGLARMAPSEGREVDYIVLPGGVYVSPYALTCAVENVPGFKAYQIRQIRRDYLKIRIVPEEGLTRTWEERLRNALRPVLPGVRIDVEKTGRIEREPSGKFRIVFSELGANGRTRT